MAGRSQLGARTARRPYRARAATARAGQQLARASAPASERERGNHCTAGSLTSRRVTVADALMRSVASSDAVAVRARILRGVGWTCDQVDEDADDRDKQ